MAGERIEDERPLTSWRGALPEETDALLDSVVTKRDLVDAFESMLFLLAVPAVRRHTEALSLAKRITGTGE